MWELARGVSRSVVSYDGTLALTFENTAMSTQAWQTGSPCLTLACGMEYSRQYDTHDAGHTLSETAQIDATRTTAGWALHLAHIVMPAEAAGPEAPSDSEPKVTVALAQLPSMTWALLLAMSPGWGASQNSSNSSSSMPQPVVAMLSVTAGSDALTIVSA